MPEKRLQRTREAYPPSSEAGVLLAIYERAKAMEHAGLMRRVDKFAKGDVFTIRKPQRYNQSAGD